MAKRIEDAMSKVRPGPGPRMRMRLRMRAEPSVVASDVKKVERQARQTIDI